MGKCGVNIGVRSEFEGKIQFMTRRHYAGERKREAGERTWKIKEWQVKKRWMEITV